MLALRGVSGVGCSSEDASRRRSRVADERYSARRAQFAACVHFLHDVGSTRWGPVDIRCGMVGQDE